MPPISAHSHPGDSKTFFNECARVRVKRFLFRLGRSCPTWKNEVVGVGVAVAWGQQ